MSNSVELPPTDGLCKGHDVNKWFPMIVADLSREELKKVHRDSEEAKSICFNCEKQEECLDYALRNEPLGIWGGKTEAERAFLRSERNILVSREARIYLPGIGRRNANGFAYKGSKYLTDSKIRARIQGQ
jgi:hypothetical protein